MSYQLDAVYGLAYSLLLLNTDLHNPQNTRRMSRSAFVKNTMAAVNMANMGNETENNSGTVSGSSHNIGSASDDLALGTSRSSSDRRSVHSTVSSSGKQPKKELGVLLKEMYASIRSQPLQMPRDLIQKVEEDKQSNCASTMASSKQQQQQQQVVVCTFNDHAHVFRVAIVQHQTEQEPEASTTRASQVLQCDR